MRVFGNLMNRVAETIQPKTPEVGMGCTILMFSDRHAATIIEVGKDRIVVQQDTAKRTDKNGQSESQSYEFTANPAGAKAAFTLRKNGTWLAEGTAMKNGTILLVGERDEYYDYSF